MMGGDSMAEVFGIAALRSRQQVMRLNDMLAREGVSARIVSTPREISAGCGLSVRFELKDAAHVKRVANALRPANMIGLYQIEREDGKKMRLSALTVRQ